VNFKLKPTADVNTAKPKKGNSYPFAAIPISNNEIAKQRLSAMRSTTDGFQIAIEDLKLRGPGEIFGSEQKGFNTFKVADPARDHDILEGTKTAAKQLFEASPELSEKIIKRWFPSYN